MHNNDPVHISKILLNENQAAEFLGFTARTLQAWRTQGIGPNYLKVSARSIRYRWQDLVDWAESNISQATKSQP